MSYNNSNYYKLVHRCLTCMLMVDGAYIICFFSMNQID